MKVGTLLTTLTTLAIIVATSGNLEARRTGLREFSNRSNVSNERFDTEVQAPEMTGDFSGNFPTSRFRQETSPLGQQRADLSPRNTAGIDPSGRFETTRLPRQDARWSTEARPRQMAPGGNWNTIRENVVSHHFSNTDLRTPESRQMQEMVDAISLQQLNRFTTVRNSVSDGIPQVAAGQQQPVSLVEQPSARSDRPNGTGATSRSTATALSGPATTASWADQGSPFFRPGETRVETQQRSDGARQQVTTTVRVRE